MEDNIGEYNFLIYLKKNYPYLYDIEMEVKKIANATGYGDLSLTCIIRNKEVFSIDFGGSWVKRLYEDKIDK